MNPRFLFGALLLVASRTASGQSFPTDDPVLKRIWSIGMDSSWTYPLAQALTDSVGPRLTGTPGQKAGIDWLLSKYRAWGINARAEQYGTWRGWRRGAAHVDLVQPRVRSLEGMMLAWSPGTPRGAPVDATTIIFPNVHPEIVKGLQALFNQDNGTGCVTDVSASGLVGATPNLVAWLSRLPREIARNVTFGFAGTPASGGSDHASFACYGAPGFSLSALDWSYGTYTWHTNRDTFDKIVFDDLKNNVVMTAMLAYLASEDPNTVERTRANVFSQSTGLPGAWPACARPPRKSSEWTR